jgi:hypothetical protein
MIDVVIECVRYEDGGRKSHGKEDMRDPYTTQSGHEPTYHNRLAQQTSMICTQGFFFLHILNKA